MFNRCWRFAMARPVEFLLLLAGILLVGPFWFDAECKSAISHMVGRSNPYPPLLMDWFAFLRWTHRQRWYWIVFWTPVISGATIVFVVVCYAPILRSSSLSHGSGGQPES